MAVAGRPPRGGWRVTLGENSALAPESGDCRSSRSESGALATSSTTVRRWRRNGEIVHHLIDPRSGRPADGPWRTVTASRPIASRPTAPPRVASISGRDAVEWLTATGLPARLVATDGVTGVRQRLAGRPAVAGRRGMNDQLLWFASRGAGIVSLILLTAVTVLGLMSVVRWQRPGWPRFLTADLHSNLALMSVIFVGVHIVSAVIDPFAKLGVSAAVVPFASSLSTAVGRAGCHLRLPGPVGRDHQPAA